MTRNSKNVLEKIDQDAPRARQESALLQERSRRTRGQVVAAALKLWRDGHDPENTTVKQICEVAGIPRTTFYFYFADRDDILIELGWETAEATTSEIDKQIDEETSLDEVVLITVRSLARRVQSTPRPLLARILDGQIRKALSGQSGDGRRHFGTTLKEAFERAELAGDLAPDLDGSQVADMLMDSVLQGIQRWARGEGNRLEDMLWTRARVIVDGSRRTTDGRSNGKGRRTAKAAPVKNGPVKNGPVKNGPVKDGPVKDGPVKNGPVKRPRQSER